MEAHEPRQEGPSRSDFTTTQWSVVIEAIHQDPEKSHAALQKLCSRYWYPAYAFLRQRGYQPHEAEDLTQSFFHFVIERQVFQAAERNKGRFRSFLLAALTNFVHNERDRQQARKRGGHLEFIPLHQDGLEDIQEPGPAHVSLERHFDRNWALTLVRRVLEELRNEFAARDREALFAVLQPLLTREMPPGTCAELAAQLEMEEGALKVALHRARRRFGELLRREVAHTVTRPEDIETELRDLLATLAEQEDL